MASGCESDLERGLNDETFDFLCSVCKRKNKNTEGDHFCVDCHDYYCSICVKFHDDVPALTNHKILSKVQFQPSSTDIFYRSPETMSQTSIKSYLSWSKPNLIKIKGKNRYSVKMGSEISQCCICSICTLADGTIVVADYWNSKLKRVDSTSYTVTDYCGVSNYPCQVCATTDQEIAVSCRKSCVIEFVSIGKKMQKTRKINTEFPCRSLAYSDKRVYEYSGSGDGQQQLSDNQYGQKIFSSIVSVAISGDHSKIYVGDCKKGLIIMDRNGQLVGQFNGQELKGARCVYLNKNGSVLVCGYNSNNILQFSLDGKLLGEVLKTDRCQAVCSNTNNT